MRVSNVAKTCPFFVDNEVQKVSLRLVNQGIQVYLDSPLAGILINARSNGLRARAAAFAVWVEVLVKKGLFRLSILRLASVTAWNT